MSRSRVGDVVGGFVAGLYSVPEGIGYAQLAGVNPMLGIYSGMVPVAVAAATTGSVLMMSTLTSAIALTMGGVTPPRPSAIPVACNCSVIRTSQCPDMASLTGPCRKPMQDLNISKSTIWEITI